MSKHVYLLNLLFLICSIMLMDCDLKSNRKTINSPNHEETVVTHDTIYLKDSCIIPDYLYLSINKLYDGNSWSNNDDEYFYRILLTSIEALEYIYIEQIQIIGDSQCKLTKRIEILPKLFGMEFFTEEVKFIEWISPTKISLSIGVRKFTLDIKKMKVEGGNE